MSSIESNITLKLMIDKKSDKVVFGEANKDFVDFLFSIMSLPVGTLITFLSKQNMVGCLGELYGSIEKLNETYLQPNINKDSILQTKPVQFPLLIDVPTTTTTTTSNICDGKTFYLCEKCSCYITDVIGGLCQPRCSGAYRRELKYHKPPAATTTKQGYVQGVATYLVMDDLAVLPMSTNSFITLLNKFNVKDVGALEEMVVHLGVKEGLMLLKASLQSKTVLTDLFLVDNKMEEVVVANLA